MFLLLEIFPMQCMEMLLWGDRSIDICSMYLVLTWLLRSAAVCAHRGALKSFAKQRPKSVKRPVHQ